MRDKNAKAVTGEEKGRQPPPVSTATAAVLL